MKIIIRNIVLCLLLSALPLQAAFAAYEVYFWNNTSEPLTLSNKCTQHWDSSTACQPLSAVILPSKKYKKVFTVNYDEGIKSGVSYTFESHFSVPFGDKGNYIRFHLLGDTIGSEVTSIDSFVNGLWRTLTNNFNPTGKIIPNMRGYRYYEDNNGKKYTISAIVETDPASVQSIDTIFLTLSDRKD